MIYFWICKVFGGFGAVCDLGVGCVSYEMSYGTEYFATVWKTVPEHPIP